MASRLKTSLILILLIGGLTASALSAGLGLKRLADWQNQSVKNQAGRTNFLLLGIPGEAHAGQDLTDTLIFFSLDGRSGKSVLISLPRDIWVAPLRAKLNTVYHYAGLAETKAVVSEILGQPIHYAVLLDFSGFRQAVDALGGVEVEVARAFDDYRYPIPGKENEPCPGDTEYQCRYDQLHFDAGWQQMDGERALEFVRSRFAEGEEGTDFARSRRQQQIIAAIKRKLFSWETLSDFQRWQTLYGILQKNLQTDIPSSAYFGLGQMAFKFQSANVQTVGLEEFLTTPPLSSQYDFHWVLIPHNGWEEIHQEVEKSLAN